MTRSASVLAAAGAALAFAAVASANPTRSETIVIPNFTAPGAGSMTFPYQPDPANVQPVIGFTVSLIWNDQNGQNSGAWASDLQISFDGWGRHIGGFDGPDDIIWDFDGSGADLPGPYSDTSHAKVFEAAPFSKSSLTGFTLTNDFSFNGTVTWKEIVITLQKVPTPGATALLGFAGLAALRRRR